MNSNSVKTYIAAAVIVFGFTAVFGLSDFLEKNRPALPENYIDEDLSLQGEKLKGYSFGFEGLIADWYWMRSLQYIGEKVLNSREETVNFDDLRPLNPRLLYPLLENATTLDPHFSEAYAYGAVVLPAINPEQAINFTEKGIANNPEDWRLYQYLGYIYWKLENYEKAAEVYEKGSQIGKAPPFMRMMSAKMKNEGGSRETARAIYSQMFEEAQDKQIKESAALRLLQLDSLDERDAIRLALENFQAINNRCPANWREIFPLLRSIKLSNDKSLRFDATTLAPLDPTNFPYLLQAAENGRCGVSLDTSNTKIPLQ